MNFPGHPNWSSIHTPARRYLSSAGVFLRREHASSLVELAIILAFLALPLLVGTAEMAALVYDSIEVANAAHVAASYGMQSTTLATDTATIKSAAQNEATDFGSDLNVASSIFYVCSNSIGGTRYTGINAPTNASSACSGTGNRAIEFIQVVASVTVAPPLHCPGLPASFPVSSTSIMEVEQ